MLNHTALLLGGTSIPRVQGEFFLCTSGDAPITVKSLLLVNGGLRINPVQKGLSGLVAIGNQGLYGAFTGCTGLTGPVSFPALTSIGYQGLYGAFNGCTGLTGSVSFPVLTTVASAGLAGAFNGCTGLAGSVSFPALTSIGNQGLSGAFTGCTGLTEIHFKASLSGNSQCTAANMRCTNATVYFDL